MSQCRPPSLVWHSMEWLCDSGKAETSLNRHVNDNRNNVVTIKLQIKMVGTAAHDHLVKSSAPPSLLHIYGSCTTRPFLPPIFSLLTPSQIHLHFRRRRRRTTTRPVSGCTRHVESGRKKGEARKQRKKFSFLTDWKTTSSTISLPSVECLSSGTIPRLS